MYEGPIVTPVGEGDVQGGLAGSPMSFRTSGRGKAGHSCTAGETEAQRGGARPWALPGVGGCSRHLPHHPESFPWASAPREGARRKADTPLGPPEPRGPDRPQLGAVSRTPHEPVRVRVRIPCQSPGHSQPDSAVLPSAEGRIGVRPGRDAQRRPGRDTRLWAVSAPPPAGLATSAGFRRACFSSGS